MDKGKLLTCAIYPARRHSDSITSGMLNEDMPCAETLTAEKFHAEQVIYWQDQLRKWRLAPVKNLAAEKEIEDTIRHHKKI